MAELERGVGGRGLVLVPPSMLVLDMEFTTP
jgi:hypothetical protein